LYAGGVGGGSIFGIVQPTFWSIFICNFNPKNWATRHAAVDIASGKNAVAAIQAENLPQRNPVDHFWPIISAALSVRYLSSLVAECIGGGAIFGLMEGLKLDFDKIKPLLLMVDLTALSVFADGSYLLFRNAINS
jgi:hypothetical protein